MKIAVIGLGIEGKNAVKALLDNGDYVYASDLNQDIVIPESGPDNLDLDLGQHDMNKINSTDAVVLSPSLWDKKIAKQITANNKLLSDVLTAHKSIFTVGVTGTNGKTTTCIMIKNVLEESGFKVLLGGNAGGGFEGYTKLFLEASQREYDIMVVEVCDMTLDFASHVFDFDIVLVTNLGYDHMDFHGTLENYRTSLCRFLKGKKKAFLNEKDPLLSSCAGCADKTLFYGSNHMELKLFGNFNQENASGTFKVAEELGILPERINTVLKNFGGVEGRTTTIDLHGCKIIVGKTDNSSAAAAVLNEAKMDVIIIGTPRKDEKWRYDILKEVSDANPSLVVLFPGLEDTTDTALQILRSEGYKDDLIILKEVSEVIDLVVTCSKKYKNIFIGGNGQKKILDIQKALNKLKNDNNVHILI